MLIGIIHLHIRIVYTDTVKERRNRIRSLKDTLKKKFNISIFELQPEDHHLRLAEIIILTGSNSMSHIQKSLNQINQFIEEYYSDIVRYSNTDILNHETKHAEEVTFPVPDEWLIND